MPSIKFDTIIETIKVVTGFREIQDAVRQAADSVEKNGKSIDDVIKKIQSTFEIAIGGWSIGKFVNQMMQVRGQFQQTEMAFKTMLQSEEKANDLMKQMIHTAAITPFGVEDVTEGAKQLLAFNVAAEDVNKTLIGLGDVAAGMGLNLSDMVMLYGTTIAKGKMDTQDMYQFLNRGIPIADELAKVMGLDLNNAIGEVSKKIKAGKVTSDIFIQAMQNMTSEGSKFGGLMEAQSKTITGQISNIEDAIEQMFNELGKSQEGVINTGLDIVSNIVENWENVGRVLMVVVAAYGAYKAAVIAMIAIEKARIALNAAQNFISIARSITSAKAAMALFNSVCSANALGLVLGVVAAGITYFKLFGDTTTDVSEQTKKFGEDASTATKHVESLLAILKTANKDSKVYADTIKELSGIYGNYGIALTQIKDDESNLIDVKEEEIKKSQQLIEQIKLESVERNRANAISKANERYNNRIDNAQSSLQSKLEDAFGTKGSGISIGIQNIVSNDVINRFAELSNKMEGLNEHSKEYQRYLKEYNKLERGLIAESEKLANSFGFTGDKTKKASKALRGYLYELRAGKSIYDDEIRSINQGADATENFGAKNTTAADRIREMQRQLQKAGEDVHTLYGRVKDFMENYSNNGIRFHVKFDAEIPNWMKNMDIPELGRLGKLFSAFAKELANSNKSGGIINGKWMSRDKIAQRGYDYTRAANEKQTEADEKAKKDAKAKSDAEEEAKKNAKKNKKAADDAKKKAEEQKKTQEQLNEDLKQLEQQNQDETISLMQEGTKKKLKEIDNDYQKRIAEIAKQEKEFKKKNKEAGVKVGTNGLTTEQSNALNAARSNALTKYNKDVSDARKEELQSMRDYLSKYGSFSQQRAALEEDYNEKIKNAKNDGERMALQKEKEEKLANFSYQAISQGIDWKSLLSGVGNMSKDMLKPMLEQLMAYSKSDEFKQADIDTQQKTIDLIKELRTYTNTDDSATWQDLAAAIEEFQSAVNTYNEAVQEEKTAIEWEKKAKQDLADGKITQEEYDRIVKDAAEAGAKAAKARKDMQNKGQKVNDTTDEVKNQASALTKALQNSGVWKNANGMQGVTDASQNIDALKGTLDSVLPQMGEGIGSTVSSAMGGMMSSLGGGLSSIMSSGVMQMVGVFAQIPQMILQLADSIKNMVTGILDSFTELLKFEWLSDLINSILSAVTNLIDTILDLPENLFHLIESILVDGIGGLINSILGRLGNIFSFGALSSGGPADWFTNSNAKEVEETTTKLTESNDRLKDAVDALKDEMSKQSGAKAIGTAKQALEDQKQIIEQQRKILQTQMNYHGSHHSNDWYWDWSSAQAQETNDILAMYKQKNPNAKTTIDRVGTGNSSLDDFYKLTPEQLAYIRTYQTELWYDLTHQGKYDKSEYWDNLADLAGSLDEITESLKETLTSTSFDNLRSNFVSELMDMSKDAADFSDNFSEMLMQSVLNAKISDLMEDELKAFYDKWANYAESGDALTEDEINDLQNDWQKYVQKGLKLRDEAAEITGYNVSSGSQKTSSSGMDSITNEQANELNGRFTALQIAGETIASNMASNVAQMETIVNLGISTNGAVLEIRNMMIMTNSYLEDIVKYAKLSYAEFGNKMDDMVKSLKKI